MGVYLGKIDKRNGFYNFKPLYEYEEGKLRELTSDDYQQIIPESEKRNINFSYNMYSDDEETMESLFFEDVPVIFEFEKEDLEINRSRDGKVNPTGYKIKTFDFYDAGKIRSAASIGYCLLLGEDEITGDPQTSNILEIGVERLAIETQVMIRLKKEGIIIGPFEISYKSISQSFMISIRPEENKYILSGYDINACDQINLELDGKEIVYLKPNKDATVKYIDIISDKALLESFKSSIKDDLLIDGKLDLKNIDDAILTFEKSPFMVDDSTIRQSRLQRVAHMLTIGDDVDNSLRSVSEKIGSELVTLIAKYDDKEAMSSFFNTLLEKNPNILNKLPEYSYAQRRVGELQEEEEGLLEKIESYKEDLEKAKELNSLDQGALKNIEELKSRIKEAEDEYEDLIKRTQVLKEKCSQYLTCDDLKKDIESLEEQNNYLEKRNEDLSNTTKELGIRLVEIETNLEKKLTETQIDGLVANMLVEASSTWKTKQDEKRYASIIDEYAIVPTVDMTPEQMVDYMYERIREVRPLYDKNTVTNICTCIFQNFLTVFSGDPGCGKTSICNIVGQALGLEKLGDIISEDAIRYIPVSVERGWTSKRDFIGYYNPLTKSFDKNNKRVFGALQIADLEEEKQIEKLPMLILLDEANLSPMEYYWADFMNVCDDLSASNEINIGDNTVLNIPETLHFVATINNDHTTETLSPRLIDRAAVITLPKVSLRDLNLASQTGCVSKEKINIISWNTIKDTYIGTTKDAISFPASIKRIYEETIKGHLRKQHIYVSPRTELSLIKYCSVASKLFDRNEDSAKRDPSIIALDYAISQKILPKINGYGEEYCEWLKELMRKCEETYLIRAKEIIADIIEKGDANMSYYQFFA